MNRLVLYIPLLAAILIFTGAINLYTYYETFSIEIFDYIQLSEVLISFFDNLYVYSVYLGLLVLFFIVTEYPQFIGLIKWPVITIVILITVGVTISLFNINYILGFYSISVLMYIFIILSNIYFLYKEKIKIESLRFVLNFAWIYGITLFLIASISKIDAGKKKAINPDTKIVFTYNESESVETDTTNIYIGRTEKYLFLYNKENDYPL